MFTLIKGYYGGEQMAKFKPSKLADFRKFVLATLHKGNLRQNPLDVVPIA